MAKRKLSEPQRASIRKEISELLRAGKSKADTLRAVAKKYGITTITARWYLKSLKTAASSNGSKPSPVKTKRPSAHKAKKASPGQNGHSRGNGAVLRLVASIKGVAEETFSRARQAKQLIPKWQAYVSKELSLRKLESKIRQELKAVSSKAEAMRRRIKALTTR